MTRVKICGVTTLESARVAVQGGADLIGLNYYAPSPRYIAPETSRDIVATLREEFDGTCPVFVGVFVNESATVINEICLHVGLDFVQLSGDESPAMIGELNTPSYVTLRPESQEEALEKIANLQAYATPEDDRAPTLLVDAYHPKLYGGTGETASVDVALAVRERTPRLMLAGGLKPENVAQRVTAIRPWGVDVASGVEDGAPGIKSAEKVTAFVQAVRAVTLT